MSSCISTINSKYFILKKNNIKKMEDHSQFKNGMSILNNIFDDYVKSNKDSISSFGEFLFDLVKEFYNNGIVNSIKPKENEWTVFASVILQNDKDFKVVVFTNGTKSLPNKNYDSKNFRIKDCHAEILALRCLKFFLNKCLAFNLIKNDQYLNKIFDIQILSDEEYTFFNHHENFFEIFDLKTQNKKIKLKDNIFFHLYISEIPCGDCSIYNISNDDNYNLNQTGSKTLDEVMNLLKNKKDKNSLNVDKISHDNTKGKFRSKSMRNDIDIDSISFSLSCSDKLLIKNILGVQGKYLSNILEPIYFSSLIISNEYEFNYGITNSIKRGLNIFERFNYFEDSQIDQVNNEIFNIKYHKKGYIVNQCQIILINDFLIPPKKLGPKNTKNTFSYSVYWYYSKLNFYKIDPTSGLKLGTNSNNQTSKDKFRVNISRYDLIVNFLKFLEFYSSESCRSYNNKVINKLIEKINSEQKDVEDLKFYEMLKNSYYTQCVSYIKSIFNLDEFLNYKKHAFNKN